MFRLSRAFVDKWASVYDSHYVESSDDAIERELLSWLRQLPRPKYLDKKRFVRLACWKTPRPISAYRANTPSEIREVTRAAFSASQDWLKLHILTVLRGVSIPVASTILYFMHPTRFPIFDVRARTTLQKAGTWKRSISDASLAAWRDYVGVMRTLSNRHDVSLRRLDKALYAYDKWGD